MNKFVVFFNLIVVCFYTNCFAHELISDKTELNDFTSKVQQMFVNEKFDELEQMADDFIKSESQFYSSQFKLRYFYDALTKVYKDDQVGLDAQNELINVWRSHLPHSIKPHIVLANMYIEIAWDHRGGGFSETVSEDAWHPYSTNVQQAWDVVQAVFAEQVTDPHFFATWMRVARARGVSRDTVYTMFDLFQSKYPYYSPAYTEMALYLMPRWYGESGDIRRFAGKIWDLPEEKKLIALAKVAWVVLDASKDLFHQELDEMRENILESQRYLLEKYPKSLYVHNYVAWTAIQLNDKGLAKKALNAIEDHWDERSKRLWKTSENFQRWRQWLNTEE